MFDKSISKIVSGLLFTAIVIFSSCKKDETWKPEASLSGAQTAITINATGQNFGGSDFTVPFLSSIKWSAASSETWLKLPRPNGANDGYLIVKADTNFKGERKAKITVTGSGVEPFVIDVKQTAAVTIADISNFVDLTKLPFNNGSFSIIIFNDLKQNVTASASESWVSFSNGNSMATPTFSSTNNYIGLYVNVSDNEGTANRTATITIKNKAGEVVKTYTITQLFDLFSSFFLNVNWQLKKVTEFSSPTFTDITVEPCFEDNKTRFTKTSGSSGSYLRDNGNILSNCNEFNQTSIGNYSISYSGSGATFISSNFNYEYDFVNYFYLEKITGDSLKLRNSTSLSTYTRYEFVKVP